MRRKTRISPETEQIHTIICQLPKLRAGHTVWPPLCLMQYIRAQKRNKYYILVLWNFIFQPPAGFNIHYNFDRHRNENRLVGPAHLNNSSFDIAHNSPNCNVETEIVEENLLGHLIGKFIRQIILLSVRQGTVAKWNRQFYSGRLRTQLQTSRSNISNYEQWTLFIERQFYQHVLFN